jgi:hypothetical protein
MLRRTPLQDVLSCTVRPAVHVPDSTQTISFSKIYYLQYCNNRKHSFIHIAEWPTEGATDNEGFYATNLDDDGKSSTDPDVLQLGDAPLP